MKAATNQPSILTLRLGQSDQADHTLFYEVFHTLAVNPFLRDGLFLNVPCACLVGRETTADWIASAESEADRLNVPIVQAPKGGILSAYACPDQLLQAIKSHSS